MNCVFRRKADYNYEKRIIALVCGLSLLGSTANVGKIGISENIVDPVTVSAASTKLEDFIQSATDLKHTTLYTSSGNDSFKMNGRTYYQGLLFRGENGHQNISEVSFNTENLSTISFTMGHVDNTDSATATISVYLDDKKEDEFNLTADMVVREYTIDVSNASTLRFYINRGSKAKTGYAFADVKITSLDAADIYGDVNNDGKFNVSDVVLLQKWLLAVPNTKLANWKAADLCEDDRLDVFDLCLMKRMLVENS